MSAITHTSPACQSCGGEVHLEVEFIQPGLCKLYAECRDCHRAGWLRP